MAQLASEKLREQRQAANKAMECPSCHGIYFYRADCAQYSNVGYGSAEFKMLTSVPQFVLICLCGRIMKPATAPQAASGTTAATFYDCVVLADKYQTATGSNGIKQALAQDFVGTTDFNQLATTAQENMESLQEQITSLEERLTAGSVTEDAPEAAEVGLDGKPVKVKKTK